MSSYGFARFTAGFPYSFYIGSNLERNDGSTHTDIHLWCEQRFGTIARFNPHRDGAWYFCSNGYAFKDPRAAVEFKMRWG